MNVRASDADRDATVDRLREAAGDGQISLDELTERIEAAVGAVMRSDLALLTCDLPGADGSAVAPHSAAVQGFGNVKRSGPWIVPAESSFRSWLGHVKLDLREAQLIAAETRIFVRAPFGNIDLIVPEGIAVEVRARTRLGRTNLQAGCETPQAPRVVLSGGTLAGSINVRHPRLWQKLGRRGKRPE